MKSLKSMTKSELLQEVLATTRILQQAESRLVTVQQCRDRQAETIKEQRAKIKEKREELNKEREVALWIDAEFTKTIKSRDELAEKLKSALRFNNTFIIRCVTLDEIRQKMRCKLNNMYLTRENLRITIGLKNEEMKEINALNSKLIDLMEKWTKEKKEQADFDDEVNYRELYEKEEKEHTALERDHERLKEEILTLYECMGEIKVVANANQKKCAVCAATYALEVDDGYDDSEECMSEADEEDIRITGEGQTPQQITEWDCALCKTCIVECLKRKMVVTEI